MAARAWETRLRAIHDGREASGLKRLHMNKVFYNLTWKNGPPTLQEVCEKYGLRLDEVDAEFGVIAIDPEADLYTILVDETASWRIGGQGGSDAEGWQGPFSNPRIEPFGPPKGRPPKGPPADKKK